MVFKKLLGHLRAFAYPILRHFMPPFSWSFRSLFPDDFPITTQKWVRTFDLFSTSDDLNQAVAIQRFRKCHIREVRCYKNKSAPYNEMVRLDVWEEDEQTSVSTCIAVLEFQRIGCLKPVEENQWEERVKLLGTVAELDPRPSFEDAIASFIGVGDDPTQFKFNAKSTPGNLTVAEAAASFTKLAEITSQNKYPRLQSLRKSGSMDPFDRLCRAFAIDFITAHPPSFSFPAPSGGNYELINRISFREGHYVPLPDLIYVAKTIQESIQLYSTLTNESHWFAFVLMAVLTKDREHVRTTSKKWDELNGSFEMVMDERTAMNPHGFRRVPTEIRADSVAIDRIFRQYVGMRDAVLQRMNAAEEYAGHMKEKKRERTQPTVSHEKVLNQTENPKLAAKDVKTASMRQTHDTPQR